MNTLPSKYVYLQQAAAAGLITPATYLLNAPETSIERLNQWLASVNSQRFIVRSASTHEDGAVHSFAGHFWSSEAVTRAELATTIAQAWFENKQIAIALGINHVPNLLVQPFIEHQIGGVLFAPWSFFPDYAYIEYSTQMVQQVVSGNAQAAIIALTSGINAPLPLTASCEFLEPLLRQVCCDLRAHFDFPLDCEWAYDAQQNTLVILQVRPQTHLVGAVLPATTPRPAQLYFTALSETVGRLSPLSFSLLQQLYVDCIPTWQSLGFTAKTVDFMQYMPDGSVLVDVVKEKAFYRLTLMGGFWQAFRHKQWQARLISTVQNNLETPTFTYAQLAQWFQYWMVANVFSQGGGREQLQAPHAYELTWFSVQETPTIPAQLDDWNVLNTLCKAFFFIELAKLKTIVKAKPQVAFCQWDAFLRQDLTAAMAGQHQQAQVAYYDYVTQTIDYDRPMQSLAAAKIVTGEIVRVDNPASFHGVIPANCILVAPYFHNRWVATIATLRGIIVTQGSQLAHSAIVAREMGVPYCVVAANTLHDLKTGQILQLDTINGNVKLMPH